VQFGAKNHMHVTLADAAVNWHSPAAHYRPKKPWSSGAFRMCT
jgi:hypothetical protein